jgi:hypothetical protein
VGLLYKMSTKWDLLKSFEKLSNGLYKVNTKASYEENAAMAFWVKTDNKNSKLDSLYKSIYEHVDPNIGISWGARHG